MGVGWRIGIHRRCIVSWQVCGWTSWQRGLPVYKFASRQVYKVVCMSLH